MNTEQKDRQLLEIGRLHLALSKCAALELENARICAVEFEYSDEDDDGYYAKISIETDDTTVSVLAVVAQMEREAPRLPYATNSK